MLLKITSFLVSHSAQHKAAAPTRICAENCLSIPLNQLLNMLRALRGGKRFEAIWTMAHTDRANLHSKNKCLIDSSCWQKTHVLEPCQFRRARLSLVRMTPLLRNQRKIFTLRGILSFHNFLLSTGTSHEPLHHTWI